MRTILLNAVKFIKKKMLGKQTGSTIKANGIITMKIARRNHEVYRSHVCTLT